MRALDRDSHILLRRCREPGVATYQNRRYQSLDTRGYLELLGGKADVLQAGDEVRVVRRQADIDHDGPQAAAHQIGVGRAVLEADLVDVLCRLDQRADVAVEQGLEWACPALAHELAAARKV